jgi:hypothetical protein
VAGVVGPPVILSRCRIRPFQRGSSWFDRQPFKARSANVRYWPKAVPFAAAKLKGPFVDRSMPR